MKPIAWAFLVSLAVFSPVLGWETSGFLDHTFTSLEDPKGETALNIINVWARVSKDIGTKGSVEISACYTCHPTPLQLGTAFGEYRHSDNLTFRVGRVSVPFGATSDEPYPDTSDFTSMPLPYMMGFQALQGNFGVSVLPLPYIDTGLEISGTSESENSLLFYSVYLVRGLEPKTNSVEPNFVTALNRATDANGKPAIGGRVSWGRAHWSFGLSFTGGKLEAASDRSYTIYGADIVADLKGSRLVLELIRRSMDLPGTNSGSWDKEAWSFRWSLPVKRDLTVVLGVEGLTARGAFLTAVGPSTTSTGLTDDNNGIMRYLLGLHWELDSQTSIKFGVESWNFTDFDKENIASLGVTFTF